MKKQMDKQKAQVFEGMLALVVNLLLFVIKLWVGMLTGSIALIADAWHTVSDSLSSLIIIIAAKLARRSADKEHPFGHGRWELIAGVVIACLLAFIGYDFITSAIDRFRNNESVDYGMLAIIVTVISIIVKEGLAQVAFYIARKTDNPVVRADGWHHRTDTLSSVVILAGIVVTRFTEQLWWMDSLLGIICAFMIFYAAYQIMRDSITKILGEEPADDLINQINDEITKLYGSNLKTHHVHIHCYISQKELTMHLRLDGKTTIEEGHKISDVIEKMIVDKFNMTATIHIEPLYPEQTG